MINWIKRKLRHWLGIDQDVRRLESQLKKAEQKVNVLMSSVKTGVDIDAHQRGRSWAVICLEGEKKSVVRFIDLSDRDLSEILDYIRNFEDSLYVEDAPPIFKEVRKYDRR